MGNDVVPVTLVSRPVAARARWFRTSEYVIIAYFVVAATRLTLAGSWHLALAAMSVPLFFVGLAATERELPRRWVSMTRDWVSLAFLLVAYWSADWAAQSHGVAAYEQRWAGWDRLLLDGLHLRALIESCGVLFPSILELAYLLLYALPPVMLGVIYASGRRRQADRYLFTLFLGAMTAYALLPLFPSASPRLQFPGQDLPAVMTVFRKFNLWVLDHCDIHCSVCPSGHVAIAFSAAFGMMRVLGDRRWLIRLLFVYAALVAMNTVYGRYHYAIDGIASFTIAASAYALSCGKLKVNEFSRQPRKQSQEPRIA